MIQDKLKNILVNIFLGVFIYKRFAISPLGYLSDNSMSIETNYKKHLNFFFSYKFTYYLYRLLYIFHISKNVDFNFEASENKINSYKNSIFYKFKKFINLCFYKQTYRINSLSYSRYLEDKSSTTNKYITFIDGGGANHQDVIWRDGIISKKNKILFNHNLTLFLKKISALYDKDVIYCLHPKINYNHDNTFEIIKNNFSIKLNQTSSYIYKSELVIFFESSAILDAIMLKKKIINLQSNLIGDYLFQRNNVYKKLLDLYQVNIDKINSYDFEKKTIEPILENKTYNYNNFIKQNLIFEKNVTYYEQIKKILNKITL